MHSLIQHTHTLACGERLTDRRIGEDSNRDNDVGITGSMSNIVQT